jgi:hypothetical protein
MAANAIGLVLTKVKSLLEYKPFVECSIALHGCWQELSIVLAYRGIL